jgi:hypothetical protein
MIRYPSVIAATCCSVDRPAHSHQQQQQQQNSEQRAAVIASLSKWLVGVSAMYLSKLP